ncbi:hypothetical protein Mal15_12900 [Stieleria maiorica]|uniref:Secreted protein n=1 Tax=Stieleria maiorica TaxID=2795974 RepID=A0A5B9M7V9_9BACT|nr:hypothetical protein [Stieleria maiorica]QEF97251.1 hypothetical protein Mal15_12900 [Stieleria maiorica]
MSGNSKSVKRVLLFCLVASMSSVMGCGSSSGPVELQTYEPITEAEIQVIEEQKERLKDERRG